MATLQMQLYSNALHRYVPVTALLPTDGPRAAETGLLPTLYLLHGMCGGPLDWLSGSRVARYASARSLAVVMPNGDNAYYLDAAATGERWGAFIGEELPALCRRLFPLSPKREETFLAGLSMGGYGALRNGLTYADTFGAVAAFSTALLPQALAGLAPDALFAGYPLACYAALFGPLESALGGPNDCEALARKRLLERGPAGLPRLLLRCGESDSLLPVNEAFHRRLDALGVPHLFETEPGDHEWDFWDRSLQRAVGWMLP